MIWEAARGTYRAMGLFALPTAGLLVRLFIIQHDCGHGSFFPSRRANDLLGLFLSLLTFTPYGFWAQAHNKHHASSGHLNRRGIGSIDTLTTKEYREMSPMRRFLYRLYRNPFILLVFGTPFYVIVAQRFPPAQRSVFVSGYQPLPAGRGMRSIMGLDVAIVLFYGSLGVTVGWLPLLIVYLPVLMLASGIGGWLFFVQHQFEKTYWEADDKWNFHEAAVMGSSYYALPSILHWFTGNIGLHHIHHLCCTIPNYRLQECLKGNEILQSLNRMTIADSLKCVRWALWDETAKKMIGFKDLKAVS